MKYLELTEQKAKDLNVLCDFAVRKGVNSPFDPIYFCKQEGQFELNYIYHLIDVAKQYDGIRIILDLTSREINATHNTQEFLKSGGFLRILHLEKREDSIQDLTQRNLRQSIFATKDWWKLTVLTVIISSLLMIGIERIFATKEKTVNEFGAPNQKDTLLQRDK